VTQRVSRGIALLFHDRCTRRLRSTPRPHFTPGKDPVPILQEVGWAAGPVGTGGKFRPHTDSIPDRPARSQSLYTLSYTAHTHTHTHTHTHIYIYTHTQTPSFDIIKVVNLFGLLSINEFCIWLNDCNSNESCAFVGLHCNNCVHARNGKCKIRYRLFWISLEFEYFLVILETLSCLMVR